MSIKPKITLAEARRIVDLAAERSEMREALAMVNDSLTTGEGVTSVNCGSGRKHAYPVITHDH